MNPDGFPYNMEAWQRILVAGRVAKVDIEGWHPSLPISLPHWLPLLSPPPPPYFLHNYYLFADPSYIDEDYRHDVPVACLDGGVRSRRSPVDDCVEEARPDTGRAVEAPRLEVLPPHGFPEVYAARRRKVGHPSNGSEERERAAEAYQCLLLATSLQWPCLSSKPDLHHLLYNSNFYGSWPCKSLQGWDVDIEFYM